MTPRRRPGRGGRPPRPVGAVWYGPFSRFGDWYHGRRDGRTPLPDPAMVERSTPTRAYLAERTRDAYEHEHLWYERDRARTSEELAATIARIRQARERVEAVRSGQQRELEAADTGDLEPRAGEWATDRRVVRSRRRTERARRARQAEAEVAAVTAEAAALETHRARLEDDLARRATVARARVTRLYEHCAQRLSVYRRALLRHHPEPGWASVVIDAVPPPVPDWLPAEPAPRRPVRKAAARPRQASAGPAGPGDVLITDLTELPNATLIFGSEAVGPGLLPDPAVPGRFFVLEWRGEAGYVLRVLEDADTGPYVAGRAVTSPVLPLRPGATIGLPGTRIRLLPSGRVERITDEGRLVVGGLTHIRQDNDKSKGAPSLTDVSFAQPGRTVTAVIGPSGAGKTTLFTAILGELGTLPDRGSIVFDGRPILGRTDEIRHLMGYVPQSEHLHAVLTVQEALAFADRLRHRSRFARAARDARIDDVCELLHLEDKKQERVQKLSGGEKKRLSIALELIKRPRLLMLDEPTSGLDTGLDAEVMGILAQIAADGCTVAVTTHAVEHLDQADNVLAVGPGGRVVYFGPPGGIFASLGFAEGDYTALLNWLRSGDLSAAANAYRDSPASKAAFEEAMAVTGRRSGSPVQEGEGAEEEDGAQSGGRRTAGRRTVRIAGGRPRGLAAETGVLVARQAVLLVARARVDKKARRIDKAKVRMQLVAPLILAVAGAALAVLAAGGDGLRKAAGGGGSPTAALSFLVTVCVLTGQALTYSDVVTEAGVIRRECRTGCRPVCVILAKWLVFSVVAIVQAVVVTVVFVAFCGAPQFSVAAGGAGDLFAGLAATSVAAVSVGLLVSAGAARLEQAVGLATGAVIVQVALNGVTIGLSSVADWFSYLVPSRWGMGALASSTDLRTLVAPPSAVAGAPAPAGPRPDRLWTHSLSWWLADLTVLGLFSALCVTLAVVALKARLRKAER